MYICITLVFVATVCAQQNQNQNQNHERIMYFVSLFLSESLVLVELKGQSTEPFFLVEDTLLTFTNYSVGSQQNVHVVHVICGDFSVQWWPALNVTHVMVQPPTQCL